MLGGRVSHFRILGRIGEGGMGVVYRAEDEKLQRIVALKVLPPERLADEERRLRFVREARAAAAVTHPNIAVVHEIDEADGVVFIAMEFVEGKTLRAAIGGKPMSLRETLRMGVEMAGGLAAAHQARVIHRDLKPDNVMVTPDGRLKILDFGLAKLLEERAPVDPEDASRLATISDEMTQAGRVLGTASYMSPEQARGLPVDARSDLFSFGIVLYEMVTGRAPFGGATSMDVMTAILQREAPPPSQANAEAPAELDRIVGKCLEKEPGDRYQDSRDLVVDLRRLKRDTESQPLRKADSAAPVAAAQGPRRSNWTRRLVWSAAALGVAVAATVAAWSLLSRQEPKKKLVERQITANPTDNPVKAAEISPDGRYIVYLDAGGIQVRQVDTAESHPLRLPEGFEPLGVGWTQDGTAVLVWGSESRGRPPALWSVSVLGGVPRKLHDGLVVPSPDGKRILETSQEGARATIRISEATGGAARPVVTGAEGDMLFPVGWATTSRRFAYYEGHPHRGSLKTADLDGGKIEEIVTGRLMGNAGFTGFAWLRDGRAIYSLVEEPPNEGDINLWAVRVDPVSGKRLGTPRRLTAWTAAQAAAPSATDDGRRLCARRTRNQLDIYLAELDAGGSTLRNSRRLTLSEFDEGQTEWTRDGKSVLFTSRRGGSLDLFIQGLDSASAEPVVGGSEQEWLGALSPEGDAILYIKTEGVEGFAARAEHSLMRVPLAGGPPQLVERLPSIAGIGVDCPDRPDAPCVLAERRTGKYSFYTLDPTRGRDRELASLTLGPGAAGGWSLSVDGSTIAVIDAVEHLNGVALVTLADGRRREFVVEKVERLQSLDWDPSGNALYVSGFTPDQKWALLRTDLAGRSQILLESSGAPAWIGFPSVSPDVRHLAYAVMTNESNVWLLENF